MSGHTPGPWEVSAAFTVEGEFMVCGGGSGHDYGLVAQVPIKANADLIATVPALVAERDALKVAAEKFVAHYPSGINPFLDEAYRMARAALKSCS